MKIDLTEDRIPASSLSISERLRVVARHRASGLVSFSEIELSSSRRSSTQPAELVGWTCETQDGSQCHVHRAIHWPGLAKEQEMVIGKSDLTVRGRLSAI